MHGEDRGGLVLSDRSLTIVGARFGLIRRQKDGSKPAVGSNYSITRATKSLCLELDEFHLLFVNLPCGHCWKDFNTMLILKHANRCAREIVASQLTRTNKLG